MTYLKAVPGCKAEKRHGSNFVSRGRPDITGCLDGHRFELEVKVPPNKPTITQQKELDAWEDAGATVAVVYSVEDTAKVIQKISQYRD